MFICGMIIHNKARFESGPVAAGLTTTFVQSYQLLMNDVKPVHSFNCVCFFGVSLEKNK